MPSLYTHTHTVSQLPSHPRVRVSFSPKCVHTHEHAYMCNPTFSQTYIRAPTDSHTGTNAVLLSPECAHSLSYTHQHTHICFLSLKCIQKHSHSHTCKYTLNFHSPEHVYTQKQTLLLPYLLQRNKNCKWGVLKLRHRTPHIQNNDNNDNSIIHSNIFDNENTIVSIARKNIQDSYPFPLLSPWKCGTAFNTARGLASTTLRSLLWNTVKSNEAVTDWTRGIATLCNQFGKEEQSRNKYF